MLGILQILFNFSIAFIKEKNLKKNLLYMQCLALGNQTTGTYLLMSLTLNYKTRYITGHVLATVKTQIQIFLAEY